MHETAATPSVSLAAVEIVSLAAVAMFGCVFKNYVFRQAKVYLGRIRFADLTLKPRLAEQPHTHIHTDGQFFFSCM